jgi:hypothetical protein
MPLLKELSGSLQVMLSRLADVDQCLFASLSLAPAVLEYGAVGHDIITLTPR